MHDSPNDDDLPTELQCPTIADLLRRGEMTVAEIATAIEEHGVEGYDSYGRLRVFKGDEKQQQVLAALALYSQKINENDPSLSHDARHYAENMLEGDSALDSYILPSYDNEPYSHTVNFAAGQARSVQVTLPYLNDKLRQVFKLMGVYWTNPERKRKRGNQNDARLEIDKIMGWSSDGRPSRGSSAIVQLLKPDGWDDKQ